MAIGKERAGARKASGIAAFRAFGREICPGDAVRRRETDRLTGRGPSSEQRSKPEADSSHSRRDR